MNKLIGLTGKMGVGKSTAISILKKYAETLDPLGLFYSSAELVKFAQPLYDIQEYAYNRISSVVKRHPSFTKDRKLLQWIGTEWGRDTISKTLWVDIWKAEAARLLELGHIVVCDDVRFENEAELIKAMGGTVVEITSNLNADRINTQSGITNHASEAGLPKNLIDFSIENNNTLLEFEQKLLAALNAS